MHLLRCCFYLKDVESRSNALTTASSKLKGSASTIQKSWEDSSWMKTELADTWSVWLPGCLLRSHERSPEHLSPGSKEHPSENRSLQQFFTHFHTDITSYITFVILHHFFLHFVLFKVKLQWHPIVKRTLRTQNICDANCTQCSRTTSGKSFSGSVTSHPLSTWGAQVPLATAKNKK